MLRRIGSCRKMVMHLLRLLSSKTEVVRGLLKRSEDRIREGTYRYHEATTTNTGAGVFSLNRSGTATPTQSGLNGSGRDGALRFVPSIDDRSEEDGRYANPDVILYFGDIQGMILCDTIFQMMTAVLTGLYVYRSYHNNVAKLEPL